MRRRSYKAMDEPSCWVNVTEVGEWCEKNQLVVSTIAFAFFSLVLFFTMGVCEMCVVGVMLFSLLLCFQFRVFNLLLMASVVTLWLHGWRFNLGHGLSLSWE